jgi:hypothetical protein
MIGSKKIEIDGQDVDDFVAAIRVRIERWSEADLSGDGGDWVWTREPYDDCYTLLDIVDDLTKELVVAREALTFSDAKEVAK